MRDLTAKYLPIFIGGGLLCIGLAVRVVAWRGEVGPSPAPSASSSSVVPSATVVPTPSATVEDTPYSPDLTGPSIGELVVAGATTAHGLAVVGERLVWLLTDNATLGSARLDGGDTVVVYATDDAEAFGGSMASDDKAVWWSVDSEGDDPEPIYRADASMLGAPLQNPTPIATGSSPDHLGVLNGRVYWADLGSLSRFDGSKAVRIARRDQRIVSATAKDDVVYWLEAPYQGGGDLQLVRAGDGSPEVITKLRQRTREGEVERDMLVVADGGLTWSETVLDEHALWRLPTGKPAPEKLTTTGLVTAIARDRDVLFWAEAHGDGDEPTTLLRSSRDRDRKPVRIGKVEGHVTALVVAKDYLYWSGARGVERHRLTEK